MLTACKMKDRSRLEPKEEHETKVGLDMSMLFLGDIQVEILPLRWSHGAGKLRHGSVRNSGAKCMYLGYETVKSSESKNPRGSSYGNHM